MGDELKRSSLEGEEIPNDSAFRVQAMIERDRTVMTALSVLKNAAPAGTWLVSGAVYGAVWNALTCRPSGHGLNDLDAIYFDEADLSWEGEDRVIGRLRAQAGALPVPFQLRNQARVPLWFPEKFGFAYPALASALDALRFYPGRAQAVAVRLSEEGMELRAPFGLEDLLAPRFRPNRALPNQTAYETKAAHIARAWPEVVIDPW